MEIGLFVEIQVAGGSGRGNDTLTHNQSETPASGLPTDKRIQTITAMLVPR